MLDPIRAVWVDEGNDANPAKCAAHGITSAFFSIRDPDVAERILKAKQLGLGVGIFFAWNWYPKLSGSVLADVVSHELSIMGYDNYATDGVAVLADIEDHDIAGVQRRHEDLFDIGQERHRVDRPVEDRGRGQRVGTQRRNHRVRLPVAARRVIMEPGPAETAAVSA